MPQVNKRRISGKCGSGQFSVELPKDTYVMLNGGRHTELLVDTPAAAEIIRAIAESDDFRTRGQERRQLKKLASRIAGRYSGH